MYKQTMALMISLSASIANAEDVCVVPVVGGQAKLPVEFEQPYRIATSPRSVPGFDGLIVKASNRHELYKFNGSSLTLIQDDFPHVWGFAFEHGIHLGPNGEAFGFGSRPRVIFRLGSDASTWEPIESTRGYKSAFFDQGSGDVYWHAPSSKQLRQIRADGAIEDVELPSFNGDQTVSLRTVSEIDGVLSLTGPARSTAQSSSSIWFRQLDGDWARVPLELSDGQRLFDTLEGAEIQISNGFIRVFPDSTAYSPLIFRFSEEGLAFESSLPAGIWRYHTPSHNWIGRVGPRSQPKKRRIVLWRETTETLPPHFLVLGPDETEALLIPGLASQSDVFGDTVFYHPRPITIPDENPVFVRSDKGIVVLDGVRLSERQLLPYEDIGDHLRIKNLGRLNIIQSEKGVFILNDDLSLDKVENFPAESPWPHEVSIEFVDAWQSYLVIDRQSGKIHHSKDIKRFTNVETEERIDGVVGVLPDPASVLLIGEERLLVATKDCSS